MTRGIQLCSPICRFRVSNSEVENWGISMDNFSIINHFMRGRFLILFARWWFSVFQNRYASNNSICSSQRIIYKQIRNLDSFKNCFISRDLKRSFFSWQVDTICRECLIIYDKTLGTFTFRDEINFQNTEIESFQNLHFLSRSSMTKHKTNPLTILACDIA